MSPFFTILSDLHFGQSNFSSLIQLSLHTLYAYPYLFGTTITSINISSSGGILKAFNQVLAMPSGAVEVTNEEINNYLIVAHIKGRNSLTQESIEGDYEVIKSLTQTDLLVKDTQGRLYRAGSSQECQIATNQVRIDRGGATSI